jgi:hypothetical protein
MEIVGPETIHRRDLILLREQEQMLALAKSGPCLTNLEIQVQPAQQDQRAQPAQQDQLVKLAQLVKPVQLAQQVQLVKLDQLVKPAQQDQRAQLERLVKPAQQDQRAQPARLDTWPTTIRAHGPDQPTILWVNL